ncbi:saccharopine dehydrogenase NADP-binding domain-containing protein, partial [Streptomyces lavendulae]|uniref:saccharopine dehydrogenase NADP-binding domain-containing protein n=1 Tax=Streptomyces lavendulae TaxID=1914 RepID=UPI0036BAE532
MRVLLVGAGGVGTAITRIAARRDFFDRFVVADYDLARAEAAVAARGGAGGRVHPPPADAAVHAAGAR